MGIKRRLLYHYFTLSSYLQRSKWQGRERIFCLSLQKTGTTSFGNFFEHFGYPVVRSDLAQLRQWNKHWYLEEYTKIFQDPVFQNYQVFEDAPFWAKDFYQILHSQFPNARFVLFTRDSDAWFDSMLAHGKGKIIGDKRFHAKNYAHPRALDKAFHLSDFRAYYTQFYENRNHAIINYFQENDAAFIHLSLEDPEKWQKLSNFIGLNIPQDFNMHVNTQDDY